MTRSSRFLVATLAAVALAATAPAERAVDTGTANFSMYVALGDSLTAGYQSSALTHTYQLNSYPLDIYRQATGQSTGFEQPLVSDPGISGLAACAGVCGVLHLVNLAPTIAPYPGVGHPENLLLPRPYNNLGVPGANVRDLLATTHGGFHDLVLRNQGAGGFTALEEGLALHPTFVTLWIGNNDVLGAATSGIVIEGVTLTPPAQFEADYRAIANAIGASGAKLAVATIPDVTSLPFVTTLPRSFTNPATGQQVPFIGPNGPLGPGDYVLLTASTSLAAHHGVPGFPPLTDQEVLSAAEVATIEAHIDAYNNVIRAVANEQGAALMDAHAAFVDIAAHGINVGGIELTTSFLTGGLFSYDGVHPTSVGYAIVANLWIDAINAKFNGHIPPVDLYPLLFQPPVASPAGGPFGAPQSVVFTPEATAALKAIFPAPEATPTPHRRKPHRHH